MTHKNEATNPRGDKPLVVMFHADHILAEDVRHFSERLREDGYEVMPARAASTQGVVSALAQSKAPFAAVSLGHGAQALQIFAQLESCKGIVAFDPSPVGNLGDWVGSMPLPVCLHLAGAHPGMAAAGNLSVHLYPANAAGFMLASTSAFDEFSSRIAYSRSLAFLKWVIGPRPDLAALFREHLRLEFEERDAEATMETMVDEPYVNHIPTLSGGMGHAQLQRFYKHHFIPSTPKSRKTIVMNEIVGADAVVIEGINCFTHDQPYDHFLPGLPPTGKYVEIPFVAIAKFKGEKLYFEHIYWDQASVLVQLGLLNPAGLPITGIEQSHKAQHPHRHPSNELMSNWHQSEGRL